MSAQVNCSISGGIAAITLTNPDRRNALSVQLFEEFGAVLTELETSASVRAIILTGSGAAFCVGATLPRIPRSARYEVIPL